jgi:acyl carrier protein
MNVRETILEEIHRVAHEQRRTLAPLTDDLALTASGLDSLCFAILVARLEGALGTDPFTSSDEVTIPVTLGDLIKMYEHVATGVTA